MKYIDEYRDGALARRVAESIAAAVEPGRPIRLMEVCGGHTHAIYKHGIQDLLPAEVELVHGPGCPVCVIPTGRVDDAIWLAEQPGVTLATFGDMLRVPGGGGSLLEAKARGADVRMVYSPLDALELARRHPERQVVFFAVGFETTAPATAVTLLQARAKGVANFSVFCNHVTIEPPLRAILDDPACTIDGFVGPGHVTAVIGLDGLEFVPRDYGRPVVVAGFEPLDVLQAIGMLVHAVREGRAGPGRAEVSNQYARVVRREGSPRALAALAETMELRDTFEWRGLGQIPRSGLRIRPELAGFDAELRFGVPGRAVPDHKACQCAKVLVGAIKPWECKVFGTACTPERPIGTCMVSSEGACAAYYAYGRHREGAPQGPGGRAAARASRRAAAQ